MGLYENSVRTPDDARSDCPNKGKEKRCAGWVAYGNELCFRCYHASQSIRKSGFNAERMIDGIEISKGFKK